MKYIYLFIIVLVKHIESNISIKTHIYIHTYMRTHLNCLESISPDLIVLHLLLK